MLEAAQYEQNAFVGLTYSNEYLPCLPSGLSTLVPDHLKNFLKRLRKRVEPARIRFFACGEYGDESERAHYHAALFNFPTCVRGRTLRRPETKTRPLWSECCVSCQLVGETWGFGDVDLGILEADSAQYVCGYVTKKMTDPRDMRLEGRHPEFARMSLRPGIGYSAMHDVASELMRFNLDRSQADVPSALRHGKRELPLGRYLKSSLRKLVGKEPNAPKAVLDEIKKEMQPLRQAAFDASRSFKGVLLEANKGKVASFKSRQQLRQKRRSL